MSADDDAVQQGETALGRRSTQLQELARIAVWLNSAHDVPAVLNILTEGAREVIGAHQCVTNHRLGPDWSRSVNVVSLSDKYAPWHDYDADIDGSGIYSLVARSNEPLRLTHDELLRHPAFRHFGKHADDHPPLRGLLVAPLIGRDGRNLGVVQLSDKLEGDFTADDESILMQLAQMASVAVESALVFDDLRLADHRKDHFLATLAHELRNPLSPLTAAAQLLAADPGDAEQTAELAAMMARQLDQLRRLIDDLLDVSRISSGKLMLRRQPVLLAEIVGAAVDSARPLMQSARHQFEVRVEDDRLVVFGDKVRLAQIVGNLLVNAAKYTPSGGHVELAVSANDRHAQIRITDDGIGIAPEMLGKIFGLFTQVDSSNTRAQGGLGIGLTRAKTLVELHGGTIAAESRGPAQGSTFSVTLPLADATLLTTGGEETEEHAPLPTFHVLVVDDNHSAAHLLSRLLEKLNQVVCVAHSAAEALEALPKFVPDILISDIAMPGASGYELARRVTQLPLARKPVMIALTGYGQESDRQEALDAGFELHLTKPIGLPALRNLLRMLSRRG
jgi:signal transduction histidine kinase/ActR/RegA family two-component response regulator